MVNFNLSGEVQVILDGAKRVAWGRGHDRVDTLHVVRAFLNVDNFPYSSYLKDRGLIVSRVSAGLDLFDDEWSGKFEGNLNSTMGLDMCVQVANDYREARGGEKIGVVDLACGFVVKAAYLGKDVDLGNKETVARELQALYVLQGNPSLVDYLKP